MLAHNLKKILGLIPEALPLVKRASISEDFPVDNKDSCIASSLSIAYASQVEYQPIDRSDIEKVAKAQELFQVKDAVAELSKKMVKVATLKSVSTSMDTKELYIVKEANFEGGLKGFPDYTELSKEAAQLYGESKKLSIEPSDFVKRYSGNAYLDKEAAIVALSARYQTSHNINFVKIAKAIHGLDTLHLKPETVQDICSTVSQMDKEAGISAHGFDFYKEALITKEAELASKLIVQVCGKEIPYSSIARLDPETIANYAGQDISDQISNGPLAAKSAVEALPISLQKVISNLVANS